MFILETTVYSRINSFPLLSDKATLEQLSRNLSPGNPFNISMIPTPISQVVRLFNLGSFIHSFSY